MNTEKLNELAKRVHQANEKWWVDLDTGERIQRNKGELLALVISELSEALEGERKDLMDDHLPHRKMAEVEMADAYIRLLDYAGGYGFNDLQLHKGHTWECYENKGEFIFHISRIVTLIYQDGEGFYIAYALAAIERYCKKFSYDLWGALEEKLAYNAQRADHKIENRKLANGKKF